MICARVLLIAAALGALATTSEAQPGATPPGLMPVVTPGFDAPVPLGKSGLLGGGVSVEPLQLGSIQAFTSHGHVIGLDLGIALQVDLGPRWALRLPIEFGAGGFGKGAGYGELVFIPGALYRFRDDADQRWVPYVGGGVRLGVAGIGKRLVGQPLVLACCHDWGDDWGGGGGGGSDPNTDTVSTTSGGLSLEVWGGYEFHPSRWFSVQFAGAAGYERLVSTTVIVLRETLGVRISI